MTGSVKILQIFGKYARVICRVVSCFYKYLVSILEEYIMYCHDFTNIQNVCQRDMSGIVMILQIFSKYAREMSGPVMIYKYLVSMLERYVRSCHDLQIFSKSWQMDLSDIVKIYKYRVSFARGISLVSSRFTNIQYILLDGSLWYRQDLQIYSKFCQMDLSGIVKIYKYIVSFARWISLVSSRFTNIQ